MKIIYCVTPSLILTKCGNEDAISGNEKSKVTFTNITRTII
jgi:hypothetical protein